jgi:3-phosphoshikimate 1-carboxyvinyltransferase
MSGGPGAQRSYVARPVTAVRGEVVVPGDKSISHRALMLGAIARGRSRINGFLASEDCLATLGALRALGVSIRQSSANRLEIEGVGLHGLRGAANALDMGNAGTAIRLFTGLLAGQPFASTLVGDSSLMKRPMERVAKPLRQMGAEIETREGFPPVRIRGGSRLRGIHYELPVASAQVKSAVLLAGLYAEGSTSVTEPAVTRDHTERMLQSFGVRATVEDRTARIDGGQTLESCELDVPADLSSAAFFLVAGALAAEQTFILRNVGINPTRTGVLDILRQMGARIRIVNRRTSGAEPVADLEVERSELRGITVPPELVPLGIDEFPALFIAAAAARGETTVTGAAELRVKESDRIAVMAAGLQALGADVEVLPDGMRVRGGELSGGRVDSHGDHRIAMAFAVASVRAKGPIEIGDVANVATSFPGFVATANRAGLDLTES